MAVRAPIRPASAWALLAESDSDSDTNNGDGVVAPVVVTKKARKSVHWTDGFSHKKSAVPAAAPVEVTEVLGFQGDMEAVLAAMKGGSQTWGDLLTVRAADATVTPVVPVVRRSRSNSWEDFWALPFTAGLRELWSDCYDCSSLSDPEWESLMRWLFDAGWDVGTYDRNCVEFEEANGPCRIWIPPSELEDMLEEDAALRRRRSPHHCHGHSHSHSHSHAKPAAAAPVEAAPRKKSATVPRFCRIGMDCKEEGCRYVHGDTIPVQNKPCAFDGRCCGDKRTTCTYLHPSEGEVWTADLVRHRPVAPTTE